MKKQNKKIKKLTNKREKVYSEYECFIKSDTNSMNNQTLSQNRETIVNSKKINEEKSQKLNDFSLKLKKLDKKIIRLGS